MRSAFRVFVAMRIGDRETDALYSKSIRPIVRECGGTAIRVDKLEHNDDIDDRIIHELSNCDLVIADLTFARPSAYFEAGYGQGREVPVIYTARKDHLKPKADDPFGNFRIHFDLQMKNIIPWTTPVESSFHRRLSRRINHVMAPVLREREREVVQHAEENVFGKRSVEYRLRVVRDVMESWASGIGFERSDIGGSRRNWSLEQFILPRPRSGRVLADEDWVGLRPRPGCLDGMLVCVGNSLTLSRIRPIGSLVESVAFHDVNPPYGTRPNRLQDFVILVSLAPLPNPRVKQAFSNFEELDPGFFRYSTTQRVPNRRVDAAAIFMGVYPLGRMLPIGEILEGPHYTDSSKLAFDGDDIIRRRSDPVVLTPAKRVQKSTAVAHVREVSRRVELAVVGSVRSESDLVSRLEHLNRDWRGVGLALGP